MANTESAARISRRAFIVDAAAQHFAQNGYDATTMRDIAAQTKLLAGSLYYYFKSKEELFCAVHEEAVRRICDNVERSVDPAADPWTRIEQASAAYLESMLGDRVFTSIIVTEFPRRRSPEFRNRLIAHRRRFEQMFRDLVAELPLQPGVDRHYWRLALLGMLAWTHVWYRPGEDPPAVVAHNLIALLEQRTMAGPV